MAVVDHGLERVAELADQPHVLALDRRFEACISIELPDEDPRPGVGLVLESLDVGDGGADEVVHELELAPDRDAELGQLSAVGSFRRSR